MRERKWIRHGHNVCLSRLDRSLGDRGAPDLSYNAKFVMHRPMVVNGTKDPMREFSVLR
jgi:hypothetical protein